MLAQIVTSVWNVLIQNNWKISKKFNRRNKLKINPRYLNPGYFYIICIRFFLSNIEFKFLTRSAT